MTERTYGKTQRDFRFDVDVTPPREPLAVATTIFVIRDSVANKGRIVLRPDWHFALVEDGEQTTQAWARVRPGRTARIRLKDGRLTVNPWRWVTLAAKRRWGQVARIWKESGRDE